MEHVNISVEEASCGCQAAEVLKIDSTIVISTEQSSSNTQEALIFILNDDCLENICKKLPLADQINFALTCTRFLNIMEIISKMEHFSVNTDNFFCWPPEKVKNFLRVVGKHIKILNITYLPEQQILNDFSSFCRNVETVSIWQDHINKHSLLMDDMEPIEILHLYPGIDDNFFKYLKRFKCLKNLTIKSNHMITGKNIDLLNGLEGLAIHRCYNLDPENFKNICINLKNLRQLDIMHSSVSKPGYCTLISKYLVQLEDLALTCYHDDINCLAELPKLKKLGIQVDKDNPEFLKKLVRLRSNQFEKLCWKTNELNEETISAMAELKNLKYLRIDSSNSICDTYFITISKIAGLEELRLAYCYQLSDASVLKILEECLKLKRLDLERCHSLTPILLKDMMTLLKKQHNEHLRKDRIVFNGTCSFYTNFMRDLHLVDKFSDLIEITFVEHNGGMLHGSESDDEYDLVWE